MRVAALLFLLAAAVAANPFTFADPGADADDSWADREIAETVVFAEDRLAEAEKFLADQNDQSFDFQQWYEAELEEFQADQDNVHYKGAQDREDDLEDFTIKLGEIANQFAASQGDDFADFVRDIVGESINHLNQQSQELLKHLQETAQEINNLEEEEYDLYNQLAAISCVSGTGVHAGDDLGKGTIISPTAIVLPDTSTSASLGSYPSHLRECKLSTLFEELQEYHVRYFKATTNKTKKKYRTKIQAAMKKWRADVRKWTKLRHEFDDVQAREEHEEAEYTKYTGLLAEANALTTTGLGAGDWELDDSLVTGVPTS